MSINTGKNREIFSEINITPLTDIFLVLLIIMMVMAPMFQNVNNDIEMPEINSGIALQDETVTVFITKEGNIYLESVKVSPQELVAELQNEREKAKKKEVILKADKSTKNKDVLMVMSAAQAAGMEKLIVAGEPLSKKAQNELEEQDKATINIPESGE